MFFLKDPFTDDVTGPVTDSQLKQLASAGTISESWEISRSQDGPWLNVGKVKGLNLKRATTEAAKGPGVASEQEVEMRQPGRGKQQLATATSTAAAQPASELAAAVIGSVRSQFDAVRRSNFATSESLVDILDWRFRKYLTPWILRVTWVIVLVLAPLWILLLLVQIVGIWLPDLQWTADAGSQAADQLRRETLREPVLPWWFQMRVAATVWQISRIAGTAVAILWVRVVLELAIVLFNIATTLTTIEAEIKDHRQAS